MNAVTPERARWLASHVLPHEAGLRMRLARLVRAQVDVDDVVQETYAILAALDDTSRIRQPRAYLFSVARSVILQQVRRARIVSIEAVAEVERLDIEHDELSPDRYAAAGQELRRVGELLAGLPKRCRQAFLLRKLEGMSQREIAARMGISENTVEKHIGKCLKHLLRAIAEDTTTPGLPRKRVRSTEQAPGERHEQD